MRRLLVLPPLLIVLLCGFLAVSEEAGSSVEVSGIRMGVDAKGQTRIVLDLDKRPAFMVGPVEGVEPELVLHLDGGSFAMTANGTGDMEGKGVIDRVEWAPDVVRIRLDGFALPTRSFVLPPSGKIEHYRLVIDLDGVSSTEFEKAASEFREPLHALPDPEPAPMPAVAEPQRNPVMAEAKSLGPPSLKPQRPNSVPLVEDEPDILVYDMPELPPEPVAPILKQRPLIVLDPGHGGYEPGSIGQNGTREESVTLSFAKALEIILERRGYDVLLTRDDDSYVKHEDRIGLAREMQADLFMSIHADSHEDKTLRGGSVYTLSARRSEKLEDEIRSHGQFQLFDVEVSNDDGVGDILLDLAQTATRHNSDRLATALIDNMRPTMPLLKNPKRRGALLVLLSPDVPAVLVELAFISNTKDEANLTSSSWRRSAATAIADGVDDYFEQSGVEARLAGGSGDSG
ncbi:N-acetylmuramoyl-L-alanine amidase family protein [Parvularcula lutaonensis]|uniref:N-acetylmuramoyl-L-alanine amidase n=1 Tax=Parvularcula lutaonensis TaxID=491923 RepID=A0ABV7M8T0_9PROT|nr:N-acetylmuramoyl-L-alanine amidase [Parvularcula lutaonensis]GGY41476.1 hypothetical protein GCM10007148_07590 [Parvularcula lutaonensis]